MKARKSLEKGTGYFSNDHLCIALGRDTEFKKTKGTGGLIGRPDTLVKVPGITHHSDNPFIAICVNVFVAHPMKPHQGLKAIGEKRNYVLRAKKGAFYISDVFRAPSL